MKKNLLVAILMIALLIGLVSYASADGLSIQAHFVPTNPQAGQPLELQWSVSGGSGSYTDVQIEWRIQESCMQKSVQTRHYTSSSGTDSYTPPTYADQVSVTVTATDSQGKTGCFEGQEGDGEGGGDGRVGVGGREEGNGGGEGGGGDGMGLAGGGVGEGKDVSPRDDDFIAVGGADTEGFGEGSGEGAGGDGAEGGDEGRGDGGGRGVEGGRWRDGDGEGGEEVGGEGDGGRGGVEVEGDGGGEDGADVAVA